MTAARGYRAEATIGDDGESRWLHHAERRLQRDLMLTSKLFVKARIASPLSSDEKDRAPLEAPCGCRGH